MQEDSTHEERKYVQATVRPSVGVTVEPNKILVACERFVIEKMSKIVDIVDIDWAG